MSQTRIIILTRTLVAWRYCLIAALLMLVASCAVLAADTDNFFAQTLPQNGKTLATVTADYDDARGAELFVFTNDNLGSRHLRVYSPGATGHYDTIPKADVELPAGVFGYQVADINADRRDELLLLGLDAVYQLQFERDQFALTPKTIATFERLFAIPNPDFVTSYRFAFDLNADGVSELVLPAWNGVRIMQKKENGYTQFRQLRLPMGQTESRTSICSKRHVQVIWAFICQQSRLTISTLTGAATCWWRPPPDWQSSIRPGICSLPNAPIVYLISSRTTWKIFTLGQPAWLTLIMIACLIIVVSSPRVRARSTRL
ncbi:MAG: hypothetical protein E4G91_01765 [Candidatus Zixiibacteriota bacterium]|nr:MAG: hypothetical protein E4G91_01765 [candidate division Zixibacteria bacterium]